MPVLRNIGRLVTCRGRAGRGRCTPSPAGPSPGARDASPGWASRRSCPPATTTASAGTPGAAGGARPGRLPTPTCASAAGAPTTSWPACGGESYQQIARAGRRHPLDRAQDARARTPRPCTPAAALFLRADAGPGRDHRRGQERLRPGRPDRGRACWRCTRRWRTRGPQRLVPTYLGAHVVPARVPQPAGQLRGAGGTGHRPVRRRGAGALRRRVRRGGRVHRRPRPGGWRRRRAWRAWA